MYGWLRSPYRMLQNVVNADTVAEVSLWQMKIMALDACADNLSTISMSKSGHLYPKSKTTHQGFICLMAYICLAFFYIMLPLMPYIGLAFLYI